MVFGAGGTNKATTLVLLIWVWFWTRSEEEQLTRISECQQKSVVVITLFISSSSFISQQTRMHSGSPFNLFLCCFLHRYSSTSDTLNSWQFISFTSLFIFIWVSPLQLGVSCDLQSLLLFAFSSNPFKFLRPCPCFLSLPPL